MFFYFDCVRLAHNTFDFSDVDPNSLYINIPAAYERGESASPHPRYFNDKTKTTRNDQENSFLPVTPTGNRLTEETYWPSDEILMKENPIYEFAEQSNPINAKVNKKTKRPQLNTTTNDAQHGHCSNDLARLSEVKVPNHKKSDLLAQGIPTSVSNSSKGPQSTNIKKKVQIHLQKNVPITAERFRIAIMKKYRLYQLQNLNKRIFI